MSDITKCTDIKCPSAKICFKRTAKSSQHQAYADFNRGEGDDYCDSYWPDGEAERVERNKRMEARP
jgi:hypothetical protein